MNYEFLQQATGLAMCLVRFATIGGTGHAEVELDYQSLGGGIEGALNASADAENWFTIWTNRIAPLLCDGTILNSVHVVLWDGGQIREGDSTGSPVNGAVSGANVSPQVAALVKKVTGYIGRDNRGRLYLPGVPYSGISSTTSGALSSTYQGELQAAFTALYSDAVAAELQPWIISRKQHGAPPSWHRVQMTGFLVESLLATQRRRMRKAAHR